MYVFDKIILLQSYGTLLKFSTDTFSTLSVSIVVKVLNLNRSKDLIDHMYKAYPFHSLACPSHLYSFVRW